MFRYFTSIMGLGKYVCQEVARHLTLNLSCARYHWDSEPQLECCMQLLYNIHAQGNLPDVNEASKCGCRPARVGLGVLDSMMAPPFS